MAWASRIQTAYVSFDNGTTFAELADITRSKITGATKTVPTTTNRGGGFDQHLSGTRSGTFEFDFLADESSAVINALWTAYVAGTRPIFKLRPAGDAGVRQTVALATLTKLEQGNDFGGAASYSIAAQWSAAPTRETIVVPPPPVLFPSTGLVSCWPLDGNLQDAVGVPSADPYSASVVFLAHMDTMAFADATGRHTLDSNTGVTTTPGLFGLAALCPGGSTGLRYSSSADFDLSGDFTIEFTVSTSALGAYQAIVSSHQPGVGISWQAEISSLGYVEWYSAATGGNAVVDVAPVLLNTPTRFAITQAGNTTRLYRDGVLVATNTVSAPAGDGSVRPLGVGGTSDSSAFGLFGWVDELRITQGVARFTGASYTLAAAPFSATLSTGHDGTQGASSFVTGVRGQAVRIANDSSHLIQLLGANTWANFPLAITWLQWVVLTSNQGNNGFAAKSNLGGQQGDWSFGCLTGTNNVPAIRLNNNSVQATGPTGLTLNTRHLVGWSFDGGMLRLWVDGVNVASIGYGSPIENNHAAIYIGTYYAKQYGLAGDVDEVALFNRVLTADEWADAWNSGAGRFYGA